MLAKEYGDFIIEVESTLLYEDEKAEITADTLLPYIARYTSLLMASSGNMKKSFDPEESAKKLYPKDYIWGEETAPEKDYESSKEELLREFNLDKEKYK